jgi:Icc-related predicted phosphoesterase
MISGKLHVQANFRPRLEATPLRIVVVSDLHGDLASAQRTCSRHRPDLLLSCGDWGDPEQVTEPALGAFVERRPVYTTFGNHDPLELLGRLKNHDGSPVLLAQGAIQAFGDLRLAAIGGIWAKSHAKPHYVTDADVAGAAERIADAGPVDILLTHGCPIGLADLTPSGRHGGQRCFLEAFKTIAPRLHLCGHVHVPQERTLKDGSKVINVGATPEGSFAIVEFDSKQKRLDARLERL